MGLMSICCAAVARSTFDRSTCCWFPPFPCKMKSLLITSLLSFVIPIRWHQVRQFIVRVTYWFEYFDFLEYRQYHSGGEKTTPGYLYALMATIKWVFRGTTIHARQQYGGELFSGRRKQASIERRVKWKFKGTGGGCRRRCFGTSCWWFCFSGKLV